MGVDCSATPSTLPVAVIASAVTLSVVWLVVDLIRARRGARWLATLLGAIFFGWIVEWVNTHDWPLQSTHIYCYPRLPIDVGQVPFWVPVGWGGIIYCATWTAQRLRLPYYARAVAAAYLAASIDFSLDPVAHGLRFWRWQFFPVSFCEIPYDNFIAWYLIVLIYALLSAFILRRTKSLWSVEASTGSGPWLRSVGWQCLLPVVCALVASVVLVAVKWALGHWQPYSADDGTMAAKIFLGASVTGSLVTLVWSRKGVDEVDPPLNVPVIVVPVAIHATCLGLFLAFLPWRSQPVLLAAIPIQMLAGIFVFAAPWLRRLPVTSSRLGAREPGSP